MAIADYYAPGKRTMVMKATPELKGVELNGKKYSFGGKNYFYVKDRKAADAIQQKYGSDVATGPLEFAEPGHKYRFTGVDMPRKNMLGKTKVIGGVKYVYVLKDGKLKLQPSKEG